MKTHFRIDDKVALITGAARGIGAATAHVLATQGARVAVADLDGEGAEKLAGDIGNGAKSFQADVSSVEACKGLALDVATEMGRLDILVNNAGICPPQSFADATESQWDELMKINARSQYFLMQAVCPIMKEQGHGGRIVNIASAAGRVGSVLDNSIYSGTKAAVLMFSKSIAREVAADGILINCVAPGPIETDLMNNLHPDLLEKARESIPLKRYGTADEVATLVAFLASDECSYCTGATFDINGGLHML